MEYHEDTALLIDRMCRYVERNDFQLNKKKAEELILKTYDLFDLPRPKNIRWHSDPFADEYNRSARSARSAWLAGSAGSAWSAGSAGSAGSARSALDYEFEYFVFEYEYCKNPDSNKPPNENDHKYLEYSELLLQALEAGLGYRVEWEDTLHLAPTPLVKIDDQNRFHSEIAPAIRWKGSKEFYYLRGQNFDKPVWKKLVSSKFTIRDLMKLKDSDARAVAIQLVKPEELLGQLNAKLINTGKKGTRLYEVKDFSEKVGKLVDEDYEASKHDTEYCMLMDDASTDRQFLEWVEPSIGKQKNADLCQANAFGIPLEDYLMMEQEA